MKKFSSFLMNEEKSYLGHKVGKVLTSLEDLQGDSENIGTRHLSHLAEDIVKQIRKVLHSRWNLKFTKQLKELQKIGVAIQKTISERGDLKQLIPAAVTALKSLSGKLGVKVNNLEAPDTGDNSDLSQQDFQSTGEQPDFKKQPPTPQSTEQPPMPQGQPPMPQGQPPMPQGQPPMPQGQSPLGLPKLS